VTSCVKTCSILVSYLFKNNINSNSNSNSNNSNNKTIKVFNKIIPLLFQLSEDRLIDINTQKNAIISLLYCTNTNITNNGSNSNKCHENTCSFLNRLNLVTSSLSRRQIDPVVISNEINIVVDIFNAIGSIGGYTNSNSDAYDSAWIKLRALPLLRTVFYKHLTSSLLVDNLLKCYKINAALAIEYYASIIRVLR